MDILKSKIFQKWHNLFDDGKHNNFLGVYIFNFGQKSN